MPDILVSMMKRYADENPIVGDFVGMMVKGDSLKIKEKEKIEQMKRIHEIEYQQYILRQTHCEKLSEVIIIIGVLNKYISL